MSLVQRFKRNTLGRDLIVGDIHGHFHKLKLALDSVGFNPDVDRLFSVGDLVDRGPESELSLDWLRKPWFHAVRGNHEDMAIRFPKGNMDVGNYMMNGGAWNVGNTPEVRQEFAEAFSALPVAIELETVGGLVGIVHAGCPFDSWSDFIEVLRSDALPKAMLKDLIEVALWSRDRIEKRREDAVSGVRAVVCGHTPIESPRWLGNVLHIDCGAWHGSPARRPFVLVNAATLAQEGV